MIAENDKNGVSAKVAGTGATAADSAVAGPSTTPSAHCNGAVSDPGDNDSTTITIPVGTIRARAKVTVPITVDMADITAMANGNSDKNWMPFKSKLKSANGTKATNGTGSQDAEEKVSDDARWMLQNVLNSIEDKDRYIEELIAELEERGSEIKELEGYLATERRRNAQLEKRVESLTLQLDPTEPADSPTSSRASSPEAKAAPILSRPETESASKSKAATPSQPPVPSPELPELPKAPKTPKAIPAVVKPAPVLTFPIYNGGKVVAKNSKTTTDPPENIPSVLAPDNYQPIKDLRDMTLEERAELFRGPTITILIGNEQVRNVPKYMFMAASPRARTFFLQNPKETYMPFDAGEITAVVAAKVRDWLVNMGSSKRVFSLKLHGNIVEDLAFRRDCILLGMDKYVAHFTRQYCDKIRKGFPSLDDIAVMETFATREDAVWDCLCNNLANMRVRNEIPDRAKFDEFLKRHEKLAKGMEAVDAKRLMSAPEIRRKYGRDLREGSRSQSRGRSNGNGKSKQPRLSS